MNAEQIASKLRQLAFAIESINAEPTLEENRVVRTAAKVLKNNLQYHSGETGETMIFVIKFLETISGTEAKPYNVY